LREKTLASESASPMPRLMASCRTAMCLSRTCVGHVWRISYRNSQHCLQNRHNNKSQ